MPDLRLLPRTAALALAATLTWAAPAAAGTWEGDEVRLREVTDIARFAGLITKRSLCVGAGCVIFDCEAAPDTWKALVSAQLTLRELDAELLAYRDLHMKHEHVTQLNGYSQADLERVNWLRTVQLVQDSISVVYITASEIASSLDLYRSLAENTGKWTQVFGGDASPFDAFAKLKDIKSIASRVDAFTKYPDTGKNLTQSYGAKDVSKLVGEAYLRWMEIERKRLDGSLTDADRRKAWLSQVKDLADMILKIDRMTRQAFTAEVDRDWGASSEAVRTFVAGVRRINVTRHKVRETMVDVDRAMRAFHHCYARGCGGAEGSPPAFVTPAWSPIDPMLSAALRLDRLDSRLREARDRIAAAAAEYGPMIDVQSRIELATTRPAPSDKVDAKFSILQFRRGGRLLRCIPEDVRMVVFAAGGDGGEVMDVGPARGSSGRFRFKVQRSLAGEWRTAGGALEVEIAEVNDRISITRKDTPVAGRDRVYSGTLKRFYSEPGDCVVALVDAEERRYLPVRFTVAAVPAPKEKGANAYSVPAHADDISPAVPRDIRERLLEADFRGVMKYRASLVPILNTNAAPTLQIDFFNHRLRYGKRSREVVPGSVEEKKDTAGVLRRVEAGR